MKKILLILLSAILSTALMGQNLQQKKQANINFEKYKDNTSVKIYDKHLVALQKSKVINNKYDKGVLATKQRLDSIITKKIRESTYQLIPFEKYEYTYDQNGNTIIEIENAWYEYINQWVPITKFEYVYDGDGYLTLETEFEWDEYTNQFISLWKIEYTNDLVGNPILIFDSYRDDASSPWNEYWKGEYTYDVVGNLVTGIGYDWNESTSQWLAKGKSEFTFNSSQNMTSDVYSEWVEYTSLWKFVLKDECTYDTNENLILWMHYQWPYDDSNVWVEYSKYENTFNASGYLILQIWYEWDFILSQWYTWRKVEYAYNTNNELIINTYYNSDSGTSQWNPTIKYDYTRDGNGNTLTDSYSSWDENTSQWINTGIGEYEYDYTYDISDLLLPNTWDFLRDYPENIVNMLVDFNSLMFLDNAWVQTTEVTYYYSEANVGIDEISDYGVKVFPVPATEYVIFVIDKTLSPIVVEIIDIQGKIVLNLSLSDTHKISVQELKAGMYMYKLVTTSGNYIGKILIE